MTRTAARRRSTWTTTTGWADVVGAHWTYCTATDIDLLVERGVHMAHCPANSYRRGPHQVLAGRILDAGVNIAFGTDNMTETCSRP